MRRIVSHTPGEIVAEVDVSADAVPGKRDIAFRRSVLQSAIAVYDRVDYIKVLPDAGLAIWEANGTLRAIEQFEAIGYQRGADGKPHTADDVELGPGGCVLVRSRSFTRSTATTTRSSWAR